MNKQEIITVLYELHKITGFRISLHGRDFEEIGSAMERIGKKMASASPDSITLKTVSEILKGSAERAKKHY